MASGGRFIDTRYKVMKRLYLSLLILMRSLVLVGVIMCIGCNRNWTGFEPDFFDKIRLASGAYVKLVESDEPIYDLNFPTTTVYEATVEFVDVNDGQSTMTYDVYVRIEDGSPHNGSIVRDRVLWRSFSQDEFTTAVSGYQSLRLSIPLHEIATSLGLLPSEISYEDTFHFTTELTLDDGQRFTSENSTQTINGSGAMGFFDFDVRCICAMPSDAFTGLYQIKYLDFTAGPHGPIFGTVGSVVTLLPDDIDPTARYFDFIYLPDVIFTEHITMHLRFGCETIFMPTVSTLTGCGSGPVTICQGELVSFDMTNDSSFSIRMIEFADDGGCNVEANPMTIQFVRR